MDYKNKEQLVNDVIENLKSKLNENVDYSEGEPLRTIIEAIMQELDYQYWQLEQNYNNSYIDTAYGEDLGNLVAILGINRKEATKSTGNVRFSRETPATQDYYIPAGTLVETLPTNEGIIVQFVTLNDSNLLNGNTFVDIEVEAVDAGILGNVTVNSINIINDPPLGIEKVTNVEPFIGGEEEEEDEALRKRALAALETAGKGTIDAIKFAIDNIDGIREVSVVDMARGIGTIDVLVLGDIVPLPQDKLDEVNAAVSNTKSAGIDVLLTEPDLITQDVNITLTIASPYTVADVLSYVNDAIINYIDNLDIGETLILNQLRKVILNADENILDMIITTPADNITVESNQVIRKGAINIQ